MGIKRKREQRESNGERQKWIKKKKSGTLWESVTALLKHDNNTRETRHRGRTRSRFHKLHFARTRSPNVRCHNVISRVLWQCRSLSYSWTRERSSEWVCERERERGGERLCRYHRQRQLLAIVLPENSPGVELSSPSVSSGITSVVHPLVGTHIYRLYTYIKWMGCNIFAGYIYDIFRWQLRVTASWDLQALEKLKVFPCVVDHRSSWYRPPKSLLFLD